MNPTDQYYLRKDEPVKGCLLALRDMILTQDSNITETQKWGMPCFSYKDTIFCYLWTDKKTNEPYILFVEGKRLLHPELEEGNRAKMKIFRVDPNKDLPTKTITLLLKDALNLYTKGIIKIK
jgi:hypothetical protein